MGFTYFVIAVIAVLLGYYIWAIKQEASPKLTLHSEDVEEEVEYEFSEPIRVSEEYIMGRKMEDERQGKEVEAPQPTSEENKAVSLPKDEVEFMHLIDFSKAKRYGNDLASLVQDVLSPTVSSVATSEVEFFHLTNLRDHILAGRQMFSGIQIA
ncbi:MAG: hypothetical protein HXN24_07315 [Porphyromonas sp.]|nr:hypothetical protein [Porphyromonas sp.]